MWKPLRNLKLYGLPFTSFTWSVLENFILILWSLDTKLQVIITSRSWIRLPRKARAMSPVKLHGLSGCWVSNELHLGRFSKVYEAYSEPCQTFKMELFSKTVNGWKLLSILAKSFILSISQGFECCVWDYLS